MRIREAVLAFAIRRSWTVISHAFFSEWAIKILGQEDRNWVALDPLLPVSSAKKLSTLRATRNLPGSGSEPISVQLTVDTDIQRIGLLDDAAATGQTLRVVNRCIGEQGGSVETVVLCAATAEARRMSGLWNGRIQWHELADAQDWRIIHLRDGCAFLPYAGRFAGLVSNSGAQRIEVRYTPTAMIASLWAVLSLDRAINAAMTTAPKDIASGFSEYLGRPGAVRDLPLLGDGVPAYSVPDQSITADTRLASLASGFA
jgi:hypothetical protein